MLRKALNIFISISLLLPVFTGGFSFFSPINNDPPSFQKPCNMDDCDMDHCNPYLPKCPLCPSSNSFIQLFRQEVADYLPTPTSSFILFTLGTLSDQGFVRAIFHPPTSIL
jgi:hypothetical protein